MDLNLILSLNFEPVNFEIEECLRIGVLLDGRTFNVHNGKIQSGILKHKQNKKLFIVFYEHFIFIGLLGDQGFDNYVELRKLLLCHDEELYEKIIKMTVSEYTKTLKSGKMIEIIEFF